MAFPSLTREPTSVIKENIDNSIKVSFDGGYEHRRPRYTRVRYRYSLNYDYIPEDDRNAIHSHFSAVGTHTPFNWTDRWTDPQNPVALSVRYEEPPKTELLVAGWYKVSTIQISEV
jgi:hypothetical protein